jgi:signal transduction histidine kinase
MIETFRDLLAVERPYGRVAARYLLALIVTLAAALLQHTLSPILPASPHLFFYPAVFLSAWLCGAGPGISSALLSTVLIAYFFLEPVHSWRIDDAKDALDLGIFAALAVGISYLIARTSTATEREARARAKAEDAVRAKDRVLNTVSHDLKNPLNTIALSAGLIEGLITHGEASRAGDHAARIRRSADRAARLVADLLDASRIESGKLRLDISKTRLDSLLEDAVSQFKPIAAARDVEVTLLNGADGWIYCDQDRLLQVLSNLIGNAVQYVAPHGSVRVSYSRAGDVVRIAVADSGPGMTPEQLEHVCEPFWRGQTDSGGTGLGLFISREIARAHGGRLEIDSTRELGTTVSVELPNGALSSIQNHIALRDPSLA